MSVTYHDDDPGHTNAHNDHVDQINAALALAATKADAGHGHGEAEITNLVIDLADHNSRLTSLEVDRSTRVLVLGPGDPVPDGTPSGTVILRTA